MEESHFELQALAVTSVSLVLEGCLKGLCLTMSLWWLSPVNQGACTNNLKNVKLHPDTNTAMGPFGIMN
jgi:hypothetical protein